VIQAAERLRQTTTHVAVVLDEHGAVEGIVTPADVLAAMAGELPEGRPEETAEAARRPDGSWLVDGRMDIHRVERLLGVQGMGARRRARHAGGFVLWELGRMPRVGESFAWRGPRSELVDPDGRRIDKVLPKAPQRRRRPRRARRRPLTAATPWCDLAGTTAGGRRRCRSWCRTATTPW
jgi:putative hemolysin